MDGVKQGQEERVRGLQKELQGDLYRDADRKHKDMLIMLKVGVGVHGIYVCNGNSRVNHCCTPFTK